MRPATRALGPVPDQAAVDAWVASHEVTSCPAAICAPSTAELSEADAAAHAARGLDPVGEAWRAKYGSVRQAAHQITQKKRVGGWATFWARKRAAQADNAV